MAGSSAMSTNQQMNVMGSQQQQQQQVTNSSQMAPQNETVTSQAQVLDSVQFVCNVFVVFIFVG